LAYPFVVLETVADQSGISHYISVPEMWANVLESLLQAHTPGARYERVEAARTMPDAAVEYRLTTDRRPLRVDASALSARLLTNLHPLRTNETIYVQWVLAPAPPVAAARVATVKERDQWLSPAHVEATSEEAAALRAKQAHPLLLGVARIGVAAPSRDAIHALIRRTEIAWHGARAPSVHLRRRLLPVRLVAKRVTRRAAPQVQWDRYNTQELTGLVGWPIDVEQLPGLVLGGCRPLAPSPLIPSKGTVIGEANFPGSERPVAMEVDGLLRGILLVGPPGVGKSSVALHMSLQHAAAGHAVVVVDPKGDLASDFIRRVSRHRYDDVIVLDPADDAFPVGLNPLAVPDGMSPEVAVENLLGTFQRLFAQGWGARTDDVLRAALLTLATRGNACLTEVGPLLQDATFRRRIVGGLDDPIGLGAFWGWWEALSEAERINIAGPPMNKVRSLTMRPRVRGIVGQVQPRFSMSDVFSHRKILVVSLASGQVGDAAARLLMNLVIAEVWNATKARAATPGAARSPVLVVIDEAQNVVGASTSLAAMAAEARGLGVGICAAHQTLGQLDQPTKDAFLGSLRSRLVFQTAMQDARTLAAYMGSGLTPDDLQDLEPFQAVARLYANGQTQPSVTIGTLPPPEPVSDGEELRELSRKRYGMARSEVERAIRDRQLGSRPDAPVGRRRLG
jgi:hypothetical protein